jgi:hypothetical protein
LKRALQSDDGMSWGSLAICATGLFMTVMALKSMSLAGLVFSLLPWTVGSLLFVGTWRSNQYLTVRPATSVTGAIDLSGDLSMPFEPAWCRFRFRDESYAMHFRRVNASRLWDPQGTAAKKGGQRRQRWEAVAMVLVSAFLALLAVWWLYDVLLKPAWDMVGGWVRP